MLTAAKAEPIDLNGLGVKGLFRADGVPYKMTPDPIEALPAFYRNAATDVWRVLMKLVHKYEGDLDEKILTRDIAEDIRVEQLKPGEEGYEGDHRSESYVYKGLYALEKLCGLIVRIQSRGRRLIRFVTGLLGSDREKKKKNDNDASLVVVVSSNSNQSDGAGATPPEEPPPPAGARSDLVDAILGRARGLVDGTSAGSIADAVSVFSAEWVGRALDVVEKRNRKPGNARKDWGFVLGILKNWRKTGGPPDDPAPALKQTAPLKASVVPADGPDGPMSAEELAEVLGRCKGGPPPQIKLARVQLRQAVNRGLVAPELAATIPPELLAKE